MQNLFKHLLIFFCIFFLSLSVNAGVKKTSTSIDKSPPKKNISPKTKQNIKYPLSIKGLTLKNGAIHVTIVADRILLPADYASVTLNVTTPQYKTGKKWSLQKVDLKRSFSKSKKPVAFNTKVVLKVPGTVTATLSKGIWKTSRKSRLSPKKIMSKELPETKIKGKSPQIKGTKKKVVPMISENNGIAISTSSSANSMIQKRLEESSETTGAFYREALELPIEIIAPVGNDQVIWGGSTQIRWTMPEGDDAYSCGDRVQIYAVREGRNQRILLTANWAEPGDNTWTWVIDPETIHPGRYQILIESSEGCTIRGAVFEVTGCDYAIKSVTFLNGRSLGTGIDARDGSIISGTFRVRVQWNRIELPSTFAPGTAWGNLLTVRSTLTNDIINIPMAGTNFDYTTATITGGIVTQSYINVDVPFEFARDNIARMMTDSRNIPLEFSFIPTGASVDIDGSNNRLEADMKVTFAKIVDLQIMFYLDDFNLSKDRHWPGTAPIYDYHFTQSRIRVHNAATTIMGTAPADLLNVPVAWYIEWKPDGGNWSPAPIAQGRFEYDIVSADWTDPLNLSGSFSTVIDDPNRTYRLRMVIDPDNEYIDSNRSDNQFSNTIGNPD
jgi:hypothetical protein